MWGEHYVTHAAATSHDVRYRYSAAEWSAAAPLDTWDPIIKAAHERWGGGRELSHLSLLSLLDLLCQLQASADEVAEVLLAQAPPEVQQVPAPPLGFRSDFLTR